MTVDRNAALARHNSVVDLNRGVAVRLAELSLPSTGRLRERLLIDSAMCGAVLADLALAHRLAPGAAGLTAEGTPTGFAPADHLLADIARRPGRTLEWWLNTGTPGERDLADHLVTTGAWSVFGGSRRKPGDRYRISDERRARDVKDLAAVERASRETPEGAALQCIVLGLGLGVPHARPEDDLFRRCAHGEWLVRGVVDYVLGTRDVYAAKKERPWQSPLAGLASSIRFALEERHYR